MKKQQKSDVFTLLVLIITSQALFNVSVGRLEFAEALMVSSSQHQAARRTRQQRSVYYAIDNSNRPIHWSVSPTPTNGLLDQQQQQQRFQRPPEVQSQCCACNEAKYELVLEGLWSKYTHPDAFPVNQTQAYFGEVIGASHSDALRMWSLGELASEGVRELAETGATKKLESELKQGSSLTRTIIKAREMRNPTLNSKVAALFRTDRLHHLVSVLSKVGPSPDWMLGVAGVELCQSDCSWLNFFSQDLYLLDAGTDSGAHFTAPDAPTRPQEKIHLFERDSPRSVSLDGLVSGQMQASASAASSRPFARLTMTRQSVYHKSCDLSSKSFDTPTSSSSSSSSLTASTIGTQPLSGDYFTDYLEAPSAAPPVECRYTDWSDWSACTTRCGKGIRTRTRSLATYPNNNQEKSCHQGELMEKEICLSDCPVGTNVTCVTRDWSEWSSCSNGCGNDGIRKRYRSFIGPMPPICGQVEVAQVEPCSGPCEAPTQTDLQRALDATEQQATLATRCELTSWSAWSECPVACGRGTTIRVRQFVRREDAERCKQVKLIEKKPCQGNSLACARLADKGGGGGSKALIGQLEIGNNNKQHHKKLIANTNPDLPVIDCILSAWGPWSTCSALCGQGKKMKSRYIIQMPQNGGKPCDKKLNRTQKCKDLPPCPPISSQATNRQNQNNNNNNNNDNNYNKIDQRYQQPDQGVIYKTTTTTISPSSMLDDEDDSKFSKLIRSDLGSTIHLQPLGYSPTLIRYNHDHEETPKAINNNNQDHIEVIGSSNFQIKNGYILSSLLGNYSMI